MGRYPCAILLAVAAILSGQPAGAADNDGVDTALVLAFDVSLSVNDSRYNLQKEGTAEAFESDDVAQAIASGRHNAIEVTVMEFSDPDRQTVTIPWTKLTSAADAHEFAARIRGVARSSHGLTGLANALLTAGGLLKSLPSPADRRIIDLSSDGMSNIGTSIEGARDAVVAEGITINGLPILSEEPALGQYYELEVIGGPDSFVEIAQLPANFADAIHRKLARELLLSNKRKPLSLG